MATRPKQETLIEPAPDWAGFDDDLRESADSPEAGAASDLTRFAIDGVHPERVVCPTSVPQVCRIMEIASARGLAVVPAASAPTWDWARRRGGLFLFSPSRR